MTKRLCAGGAVLIALVGSDSTSTTATSVASTAPADVSSTEGPPETSAHVDSDPATRSDTTDPDPVVDSAIDDPRAPGVTDDEVLLGVTYFDFTMARNVIGYDHGDFEAAYQALIDEINANGGIHGRQLRAVFAPVDPFSPDSAAAACTRLTEDEQVFVAVGFFEGDNVLCYLETHGAAVVGGGMSEERRSRAAAPWFTTDVGEDLGAEAVRAMAESGEMDRTVGVVGVTGEEATYENTIRPVLEENGIEPASVAYLDVSSRDAGTIVGLSQSIVERFQADGVDQILIVGGGAGGFFPIGISLTGYRPQLFFSHVSGAITYSTGDGSDLSVLEGALSGGLFDAADEFLSMGGATEECVAVQTAAGLELVELGHIAEGESRQFESSLEACANVALLTAILEAAGRDLNYGTFGAAGSSLGEIEIPGYPDPWTFGPGASADGDPVVYLFAWDSAAEEFVRQDS